MSVDSAAQSRRDVNALDSAGAGPRARSGQAIILGKDDVIRVADMTPDQYRTTLNRLSRDFGRRAPETIYFAKGSSALVPVARQALTAQARWIAANPRARVRIVGYTDADGSAAANRGLANARARAVASYLVGAGVPRDRLVSIATKVERASRAADRPALRRAVTHVVELADPVRQNDDGSFAVAQNRAASGGAGSASGGGSSSGGGGTSAGSGDSGGGAGGASGGGGASGSGGTSSNGGGSTNGGSTSGGSSTSGGTADSKDNNGKAHGRNGTQPGRNR